MAAINIKTQHWHGVHQRPTHRVLAGVAGTVGKSKDADPSWRLTICLLDLLLLGLRLGKLLFSLPLLFLTLKDMAKGKGNNQGQNNGFSDGFSYEVGRQDIFCTRRPGHILCTSLMRRHGEPFWGGHLPPLSSDRSWLSWKVSFFPCPAGLVFYLSRTVSGSWSFLRHPRYHWKSHAAGIPWRFSG